jgi:hypothetical protein
VVGRIMSRVTVSTLTSEGYGRTTRIAQPSMSNVQTRSTTDSPASARCGASDILNDAAGVEPPASARGRPRDRKTGRRG